MQQNLESDSSIRDLLAEQGLGGSVTELDGGDELAVLCDELRQNPNALANVNVGANMASMALNQLRSEGRATPDLLRRMLVSSDPRLLLRNFLGSVEGEKFRHAVMRDLAALNWNDACYRDLDADAVAGTLTPQDFGYLINNHRELLLREGINPPFCADAYWEHRIGWYVDKRDFRRAWDEIGKARKGFRVGRAKEDDGEEVRIIRRFAASKDTVASVVDALFRAMVRAGRVEALKEGQHAFWVLDDYWRGVRSKKRIRRVRQRHPGMFV